VKALTLHQPWADLIAHHGKTIENRTWRTDYRGPVAIHAGGYQVPAPDRAEIYQMFGLGKAPVTHPTSAIIAVARLVDIHTVHQDYLATPTRRRLCSPWAEPHQFHWVLADVQALPEAVPCPGQRRLWTVPAGIAAQLPGGAA